jgi:outer membrane immunogenic protein
MALKLRTAALCAASLLFAVPAHASCTGGPFAGPYIGATIGWAHLDADQSAPPAALEPKVSGSDDSFTAGALVGYNFQCGHIVAGVEADINYLDLAVNNSWPDPIYLRSSMDYFGTVRGRLGVVVHPRVLLYGTAGVAYADVSHRLYDPAFAFSQKDNDFQTGWVVGGGIELLHYDRWIFRTEVLYADLDDKSRTYTITTGCGSVCTGTAHWDDSFWVWRVGLSLKLHEERRVVPLK